MVAIDPAPSPGETRTSGITGSVLAELAGYASGLPKTVHYFDDYQEVDRHIRASDPEWRICLNGQTSVFRVGSTDTAYRHLNQRLSSKGAVVGSERWNLTEIAGSPGETIYLSHLGTDEKTLAEINRRRAARGEPLLDATALPRGWQDLLRMLVVKHLIAEKKTPGHAAWNLAHPARCLATCCFPKEPCAVGGRDRILYLRHFSEKQAGADARGIVWAEKSTSVLTVFEDIVEQTVTDMLAQTKPLRERLKAQNETSPIFPELAPDRSLDLAETYPRVTGNPVICRDDPETEALLADYRETGAIERLRNIERRQTALFKAGAPLHPTVEAFAKRSRQDGMPWRDAATAQPVKPRQRLARGRMVVRVSDLEDFLRELRPTKLSDRTPFLLSGGRALQTHELLFLHPKRALNEGRNGGVCDITRYPFVGHLQPADIQAALQDRDNGLFAKYGKDDEARAFALNSHSIRHLHNNELFSAGVSDTVITHRFGRKTVAQSHEYDNRTLAQHLTDIEVPADALDVLEGPALDAFRLIETGRAEGELVSRFKALQSSDGDDSALAFLAEAVDQVQLTPYGVCTASFISEACPKHLTCLSGCSHLIRTADAKTVANNRKLVARYEALLDQCPSAEMETTVQKTWREKLETDVGRLRRLVATAPGQQVFPDGDDHVSPCTPLPEGLR